MATQTGSLDLKGITSAYSDQQQYFWVESSSSATWGGGAHITNVAESAFKTAAGTWGTNPTAGGYNLLMNTDTANATGSLQLRNGALPIMNLDNDSLDFNTIDTTTTPYSTINVATFGANGARIGTEDGAHSMIDGDGQRFYASDGTTQLANIGYGVGSSSAGVVTNAPYYTFGTRKSPTDDYSASSTYKLGDMCWHTTNGVRRPYICDTPITTPEAWTSEHWLLAIGNESFAEGRDVVAASLASHAEGVYTIAMGGYSHAEGANNKAYGYASHAEGGASIASGRFSHAQNQGTIASKTAQTVIGKYNLEDTSDTDGGEYAFIIGNGTATETYYRSNAFTVGWDGNVEAAGSITDGQGYSIPHAEEGTTSISTTTGTLNGHVIGRYGRVRMLQLSVKKSSATAAGANLYQGQINTVADRPLFSSAYGSGYYGSAGVLVAISQDGKITVRVVSAQIAANSSTWCGVTYIAQGD